MTVYDEVKKEFVEKLIHFTVDGKERTDEDLALRIPHEYATWFEGANFRSFGDVGLAVMFANCAHEARDYRCEWKAEQDEMSLRHYLGKKAV